jgi:hypothetical protein
MYVLLFLGVDRLLAYQRANDLQPTPSPTSRRDAGTPVPEIDGWRLRPFFPSSQATTAYLARGYFLFVAQQRPHQTQAR